MSEVLDSLAMFAIAVALIGFFTLMAVVVWSLVEDTARWLRGRP